jgi:hypothetical protein
MSTLRFVRKVCIVGAHFGMTILLDNRLRYGRRYSQAAETCRLNNPDHALLVQSRFVIRDARHILAVVYLHH